MWAIKKDTACPLPPPCISNCANRLPHSNHYIHMSVVMSNVPSSTSVVTEPGRGEPPFQIDSSENRCAMSIQNVQADTLSKHSDIRILECAPLNRNVAERDEAGTSISELPSLGKRKEPSSPLDELLDCSSESSRADSPLPPRKVARISHALKRVINPTKPPRDSLLEASSSSMYPFPLSKLRVI